MVKPKAYPIFTLRLRHERHVVDARQRAREIAARLGFDHQEQIRLATAASELARNAFRYATGGVVEYMVLDQLPQLFVILVTDAGPGIPNLEEILNGQYVSRTGLGKGIVGTRRLMDVFSISGDPQGTRVEVGKWIPASAPPVDAARAKYLASQMASSHVSEPYEEIEHQNQELLKTLESLREKQDQLAQLNQELEDTNRGVVALYAELDQHADDLRRVSDLKTSFLSNLSHEFRTPLNSIISLSRLLLGRADGELSREQEKQITFIQRSASELSELVNDLLDLAKVEAGKTDVRPKFFEVHAIFGALRGVLKPLLVGNSLELTFDSAPDIPPLFTDEGKVSQILRNLISNAIKFTRRGSVAVTAKSDTENSCVIFQVADTGIGIAPDDLVRIFEDFVQLESDLQGKSKGTGLGLPLSRRLAGLLGGTLEVESEVGVGSTFTLTLPIHYAQVKQTPNKEAVRAQTLEAPLILVVEDNPEAMFIYETSLKSGGYRLIPALSIHEARSAMKRMTPALVILDRFIDRDDCLFFAGELRANSYTGPILVISVVDEPEAALQAGATAFMAKPIVPSTLASTVRELIEGHGATTLLIIDDDEVSRYLLGEALSKLGYRVIEARGGREGLHMLESHSVEGVFLDIVMPDLDGFDVLRELRASPTTASLPVIMHTSKKLSAQELNLINDMGATTYLKRELRENGNPTSLKRVLREAGIDR